MSSLAAMEEHLAARPEPRQEVFEVGHRRRRAAEDGGVEQAAPCREQTECHEASAELEVLVVDVLMRHPVSGDVQSRAEQEGKWAGSDESAGRASRRNMKRSDHLPNDRLCSRSMSFLDKVRNWLAGPPHIQAGDAEERADLQDEFGAPDAGRADIERMEHGYAGGSPVPGLAGRNAAEVAESEIESEEAPTDLDS